MSRALWFVAGAGASAYAMNRARQLRDSLTVEGLKDRASGLAAGARLFREEVARGQAEKEVELRERLGLVPLTTPELGSGRHRAEPPDQILTARGEPTSTTTSRTTTTAPDDRAGNDQEGTT